MAYSSPNNKNINYLNKDFTDFRQSLLNLAQVYFPDTYNDFTEASPGTMFIEMASYVGDVLSFYTDAQIQETFLQHAQEKENLYSLAYGLGYRPSITNASQTTLDIMCQIPALGSVSDYAPDFSYAPRIEKNSSFISNNNSATNFLTQELVDFRFSSSFDPTEITVYSIDGVTNKPNYYLLKKSVKVISAEIKSTTFTIGGAERFKKLNINDSNIIGIESITDSEGNTWTEVPYLAQETAFEEVPNIAANDPNFTQYSNQTPYLLRTKKVPKRFITRFKSDKTLEIQFGAGNTSGDDSEILPTPDNVGLGIRDGRSLLDLAYDPSNFMYSKAYGEAPSNTTLTVKYLKGGGVTANADSSTITRIGDLRVTRTAGNIVGSTFNTVINSITSNNPNPAVGGGPGDSADDIRLNAIANFSSQQRVVTKEDYITRTLALPNKFGKIAKAYLVQDNQISTDTNKRIANPNALNLYVLGYDINKKLSTLGDGPKTNLATYLEQYRMLTDAINIKDAYIINFGIDFEITVSPRFSNDEVLLQSINAIRRFFNINRWEINQPIILGDISSLLYNVEGVQNVNNINITNKSGAAQGYSQYLYDFEAALKDNILYPSQDPCIFELKYPNSDIKGRTKSI